MFLLITATVFVVCCGLLFVRVIPPYMAAIVARMGKPVRSIGAGTHFVLWPLEWLEAVTSLKTKVIDEKMVAETDSEEVVPLDFSIEYAPLAHLLIQFLSYSQEEVVNAIKQRVASLVSVAVRKRKDRDETLNQISAIAKEVQDEFSGQFSNLYGVRVRFLIDDPELPPKLVEKEVEREMQEKENERRKLDVMNLKRVAAILVKEAEKRGEKLSFDAALKRVQVQLGIVKEQHQFYGVDGQSLGVVRDILSMIFGGKHDDKDKRPIGFHHPVS